MSGYRIIITPRAGEDIEAIHEYISRTSAENAARMISRILDALEPLRQFPHRSVIASENAWLEHPVRSLVVRPYVVYFRVIDEHRVVRVLHVRHGARKAPNRFD